MSDTIAAIATAPGEGGIAIVRISGPDAETVFSSLFVPAKAVPKYHSHHLYYGHVMDGEEVKDWMLKEGTVKEGKVTVTLTADELAKVLDQEVATLIFSK